MLRGFKGEMSFDFSFSRSRSVRPAYPGASPVVTGFRAGAETTQTG